MRRQKYLFVLMLTACFVQQVHFAIAHNLTASNTVFSEIKTKNVDEDSLQPNDTIFIYKNVTDNFYHAIFIDTSHDSQYYSRLVHFDFDTYASQAYAGNHQFINKNCSHSFSQVNSTSLPEKWLPVYKYKNNYYLYAPSDWGNAGRRMINDSAFVYWYMDGPFPVPLKKIKQTNRHTFVLEMSDISRACIETHTITIFRLDSITNLSLFYFPQAHQKRRCRLYVPIENAHYFDVIVNYCDNQKQYEYEFDDIDCEQLIE
ncbi:MAG: hypothetical protein R6U95_06695 [Bacteroidales bacterium]